MGNNMSKWIICTMLSLLFPICVLASTGDYRLSYGGNNDTIPEVITDIELLKM